MLPYIVGYVHIDVGLQAWRSEVEDQCQHWYTPRDSSVLQYPVAYRLMLNSELFILFYDCILPQSIRQESKLTDHIAAQAYYYSVNEYLQ